MSFYANLHIYVDEIAATFQRVRAVQSREQINNGLCDQSAAAIVAVLGAGTVVASWNKTRHDNPFLREKVWKQQSDGVLRHKEWIAQQNHAWVELAGKHYDAEAVRGVDNPLQLPFYQRVIKQLGVDTA